MPSQPLDVVVAGGRESALKVRDRCLKLTEMTDHERSLTQLCAFATALPRMATHGESSAPILYLHDHSGIAPCPRTTTIPGLSHALIGLLAVLRSLSLHRQDPQAQLQAASPRPLRASLASDRRVVPPSPLPTPFNTHATLGNGMPGGRSGPFCRVALGQFPGPLSVVPSLTPPSGWRGGESAWGMALFWGWATARYGTLCRLGACVVGERGTSLISDFPLSFFRGAPM